MWQDHQRLSNIRQQLTEAGLSSKEIEDFLTEETNNILSQRAIEQLEQQDVQEMRSHISTCEYSNYYSITVVLIV